ncbi:MAG: DUF350 domain-containing protein [Bacteroidota bacterium]
MGDIIDLKLIVSALIFSAIGIVVFLLAAWIYNKLTPFDLWDEIVKKQNTAVAITVAAMMVSLSIIIAFAHG